MRVPPVGEQAGRTVPEPGKLRTPFGEQLPAPGVEERGSLAILVDLSHLGAVFNTLADIGHKVFSPATYPCALCAITHGLLAERAEWRAFIESLGADCEFLHRDQFHARFPDIEAAMPAIFRLRDGQPRPCADAATIGACLGVADLRALILRDCLEDLDDSDHTPGHIQPPR